MNRDLCTVQQKNRPIYHSSKYGEVHENGKQEAQLMLTTGSTRLAVSRGQQTWYHSTCYI